MQFTTIKLEQVLVVISPHSTRKRRTTHTTQQSSSSHTLRDRIREGQKGKETWENGSSHSDYIRSGVSFLMNPRWSGTDNTWITRVATEKHDLNNNCSMCSFLPFNNAHKWKSAWRAHGLCSLMRSLRGELIAQWAETHCRHFNAHVFPNNRLQGLKMTNESFSLLSELCAVSAVRSGCLWCSHTCSTPHCRHAYQLQDLRRHPRRQKNPSLD